MLETAHNHSHFSYQTRYYPGVAHFRKFFEFWFGNFRDFVVRFPRIFHTLIIQIITVTKIRYPFSENFIKQEQVGIPENKYPWTMVRKAVNSTFPPTVFGHRCQTLQPNVQTMKQNYNGQFYTRHSNIFIFLMSQKHQDNKSSSLDNLDTDRGNLAAMWLWQN